MRWHAERKKPDDGDDLRLRHLVDGSQWRAFNTVYGFAKEDPRNIVLGASTDGMNLFGNQNTNHNTWTVFVWMYNLPPWKCMKTKYIHMCMLVQGLKQPGNSINLYMVLLQEELDMLWKSPTWTWDASKGKYFHMRVALMTTVHDYLGYGYTSGQVCHGYCGCTGAWMIQCVSSLHQRKMAGLGKSCTWGILDGSRRMTNGESVEIYPMGWQSFKDLCVRGAAPKSTSC